MDKQQRKAQQWEQKQTKREYKLFVGEMKATNDDQGIIEGYLNAIGNIDYGLDRTMPGAFKRTLNNAYERKRADGDDYLWPYLWNHDYNLVPPGGIFDAEEDKKGLFIKAQLNLDYQLARDMYSSFKARTLKKQSMGYLPHQQEYVKDDGQMVRNLIEVEVLEGSGVVFPMNDLSDVTGVKRSQGSLYIPKQYYSGFTAPEVKTICGNTSGKIGPRDEAWDSSKAEKQIWVAAYDDDSSKINTSLAKKYFMVLDGDAQKKGSYSYPFWYVGDDPHICVGACKAIANAIQGARGASAPDGLKPKIETLYKRINKQYPDDAQLTPPWSDDDGKSRGKRPVDKKDFNDLYQAALAADCLEDWGDLINTLTQTMIQIFGMGDSPDPDMSDALSQFGEAVMAWQEKAVECNLSEYISDQGYCSTYNSTPYVPYSLQVGYMSRNQPLQGKKAGKSGASFSQSNTDAIHGHVGALHDMADEQAKSMHDLADGLLGALQGLGAPSDPSYRQQGTSEDDEKSRGRAPARKAGAEFSSENLEMLGQHVSGLHDVADQIHAMAEDLAENTGATTYVDPSGDEDNAKETDKNKADSRDRALRKQHSPNGTAESQEDLDNLFAGLRQLHQTL